MDNFLNNLTLRKQTRPAPIQKHPSNLRTRRRKTREIPRKSAVKKRPPELVFVIIHGTASRGARWTLPNSKIRRRLERHFDRRGHTVSFEWSGTNSNAARLIAGRELARRILDLYEEFHAPIYLVAHSHGGNIALYAMRDPSAAEKVVGVVSIATLFVKCGQRPFIPAIEKILDLLPRLLGATVLGAVALMQFIGIGGMQAAALRAWLGWTAFLLMPFIPILQQRWMPWYKHACDLRVKKLMVHVQSRSDSTIATLSLPQLPNLRLLCLSSPHDEASKCLRAGILVAETPFYAWAFLGKLAGIVLGGESGPPRLLAIAFYTGVASAFASMFDWDRRIPSLHWLTLLMIPRFAGLVILIIMPLLILLSHLFFAIIAKIRVSTGVNGKSIFDDWITKTTVHPAPEGTKDCLVKEMNVVAGSLNFRARNLRTFMAVTAHTRMYNNRKVLGEIIRWIYKQEQIRTKAAIQEVIFLIEHSQDSCNPGRLHGASSGCSHASLRHAGADAESPNRPAFSSRRRRFTDSMVWLAAPIHPVAAGLAPHPCAPILPP